MLCKKCGGFVILEWNEDDVEKDEAFLIRGECEMCKTKYAVVMQMFEVE
ncbi:MAG TPA: hypothetical protein VMW71_02785 [Thermoplasmata archaeon]|nr:hypothetical protein [Thermoplasmata archaeon]